MTIQTTLDNLSVGWTFTWGMGSLDTRIEFYELLASMLTDGLPLDAALERLYKQFTKRKRPLAPMLRRWLYGAPGGEGGLMSGRQFSDVIRHDVPEQELVLIAAGERSSQLESGLLQAVELSQAKKAIQGAVISNLGPIIAYLGLALAMVAGFSFKIVPEFSKMLPAEKWTGKAHLLYVVSSFVRDWWLPMLLMAIAVVGVSLWSLPRWRHPVRAYFDKLPPWSIFKLYSSSTFMIALSSHLKAGAPLNGALKQLRQASSPWAAQHLSTMLARLKTGTAYGEALDTGMLDERTVDLVYVYAEGSKFEQAVEAIGSRAITRGVADIKKKTGALKQVALLVVGITLTGLIGGFYDVQQQATSAARSAQMRIGH